MPISVLESNKGGIGASSKSSSSSYAYVSSSSLPAPPAVISSPFDGLNKQLKQLSDTQVARTVFLLGQRTIHRKIPINTLANAGTLGKSTLLNFTIFQIVFVLYKINLIFFLLFL